MKPVVAGSRRYIAAWRHASAEARQHDYAFALLVFEEVAVGARSAQPEVLHIALRFKVVLPRRSEQLALPVIKLRRAFRICTPQKQGFSPSVEFPGRKPPKVIYHA